MLDAGQTMVGRHDDQAGEQDDQNGRKDLDAINALEPSLNFIRRR